MLPPRPFSSAREARPDTTQRCPIESSSSSISGKHHAKRKKVGSAARARRAARGLPRHVALDGGRARDDREERRPRGRPRGARARATVPALCILRRVGPGRAAADSGGAARRVQEEARRGRRRSGRQHGPAQPDAPPRLPRVRLWRRDGRRLSAAPRARRARAAGRGGRGLLRRRLAPRLGRRTSRPAPRPAHGRETAAPALAPGLRGAPATPAEAPHHVASHRWSPRRRCTGCWSVRRGRRRSISCATRCTPASRASTRSL